MATLEELKRQNEKLRNEAQAKRELAEIQKERFKLIAENKSLVRRAKFGRSISIASKLGSTTAKVGKGIGRSLIRIGHNLNEQDRRAKLARSKLKKARKKTTKKRKAKPKRTKKKKR